jgi:adenosylcobinamide-phosphate synthase
VLNWIPARLTAAWLALVAGGVSWQGLRYDAKVTPSPNGGWPMGAMAQALDVRLSKPGVYQINSVGRAPEPNDLFRSIHLASKVVKVQVICVLLAMVFMSVWMWWVLAHG